MTAFVVVLLAGLGSYLFRISMIVLAERIELPDVLETASAFVAPAAFAALATTGVVAVSRGADLTAALAPLGAVAGAVVAVYLTRRPYAAPLAGMPVFWLLTALVGG